MTSTYVVQALFTTVSLLGVWLLLYVLLKDYRLDALRQRLFDLRGDLFDYAAAGAISFNHPAYGTLRTRINRLIRFAHRFTSSQLLLVVTLLNAPTGHDPLSDWKEAVETVESAEVRKHLYAFNNRMFAILVWHMVTGSVILMASLVFFGTCWAIKQLIDRAAIALGRAVTDLAEDLFNSYVRRFPVEQLEIQALEAGSDTEPQAAAA